MPDETTPKAGEWQPIGTAPKDGAVLVWDARESQVYLVEKRADDGSCWLGDWDWQLPNPTHWMPLPNPPLTQGTDHEQNG